MANLKRDLVFLSYARDDSTQVWNVYTGLKKRKLNVWFDEIDKKPGKWKTRIEKAIAKSRYFIFCLSEASLKKTDYDNPGFIDRELQIAWEFAREQDENCFTIIPVRLENCARGDMRLVGWEQYDLFSDFEITLDKLAIAIGGISLFDAMVEDERTENEKMSAGLIGKGEIYCFSNEYDKALSLFEAAINLTPNNVYAWYNKGLVLYYLGLFQEAIKAYDKAIEIKPRFHYSWNNKGLALNDIERHEEAIEAFEKAIDIEPNSQYAWNNKGLAHTALGLYQEATIAYDKAIEIEPDFQYAWYNLVCLYSLKKEKDKALNCLRKAVEFGFNDLSLFKKDKDLDFIRNEPEFQGIIKKLK